MLIVLHRSPPCCRRARRPASCCEVGAAKPGQGALNIRRSSAPGGSGNDLDGRTAGFAGDGAARLDLPMLAGLVGFAGSDLANTPAGSADDARQFVGMPRAIPGNASSIFLSAVYRGSPRRSATSTNSQS